MRRGSRSCARGRSLEGGFPFGVVLGLLEARVRAAVLREREELMQGSASVAGPLLLGTQPAEQAVAGLTEQSLIHALQWVVVNLSAAQPLVLVVDDLHWADAPSLRFLDYLAARAPELPVLVVGAMRPREPGAHADLLAELAAGDNVAMHTLGTLSAAASATLVRAVRGGALDPTDEFIEACFGASGGNPLLLGALLQALSEEGVSGTAPDAARVREVGPEPVARGVRSTLARLGADERALAGAVAVLGDDAALSSAAVLADLDRRRAGAAGARLQDAGVFDDCEQLCFTHPLLRRVVYDDLPAAARRSLHRQAAALQRARADIQGAAGHLLLAEARGEPWAVETLRAAAAEADARAAHATAARLLRRAVEEPPEPAALPGVLGDAALASARAGEPEAVQALEAAIDVAQEPAARACLLLALGKAEFQHGRMKEAVEACDRGLAEVHDDDTLKLELDAAWVAAALWTPAGGEAVARRLEEALRDEGAALSLGQRELLAGLAGLELVRGVDRERTLALARRAWGAGAYLEQGTCDAPAMVAVVSTLLRSGALMEVLGVLDTLIGDARRRASPLAYATWRSARGNCLLYLGRLEEAESDLEEALDARSSIGWEATVPLTVEALVSVSLEQGRVERAEEVLCDLGDTEAKFAGNALWAVVHTARGRVAMAQGQPEVAIGEFRTAGHLATDVLGTTNPAVLPWRSEAARALQRMGDLEEAARLAAEEVADARRFGAPRALAMALRAQGLVVHGAEGAALAGEAVRVLEGSGAALETARAQVAQGALLRAAGKRTQAQAVLQKGLEGAGACGAHTLARRASDELVALGGRPRKAGGPGANRLTAGERRVARLAADGGTNREIADALFVTPKAVSFHLSNAYRKLGISGREGLSEHLGDDDAVTVPR